METRVLAVSSRPPAACTTVRIVLPKGGAPDSLATAVTPGPFRARIPTTFTPLPVPFTRVNPITAIAREPR
jgi:hypothetical protein